MTARPAQASGSAVLGKSLTNGSSVSKDRSFAFSWEDWFSHASPQQRASALGLAQQQGLLYPSQLPPISNGVHPATTIKDTPLSRLLPTLLAGKTDALPRPAFEPLTFYDPELDDLQQQAVMRAVGTPDFFLLQGLPGTGKSRVLTEIILQSAAKGQRVLLLAAHAPPSLDVILQRLVGKTEVFALRHLDPAEKLDSLPPWLRGFTFEDQRRSFLERTLVGARGNHEKALAACRQKADHESAWPEMHACVRRRDDLTQRSNQLKTQSDGLRQVVECEAHTAGHPFAATLAERLQPQYDSLASLQAELTQSRNALAACEADNAALATRIAALEPAHRAKKEKRFWTPAFWASLFTGSKLQEMETLLQQQSSAQSTCQTLTARIEQIELRRQQQADALAKARAEQIEHEFESRRQSLAQQQQTLDAEQRQLDEQWSTLCNRLEIAPTAQSTDAIHLAHQAWLDAKKQIEEQCQFAQQWTTFVEQSGPQLTARLPSFANLHALTLPRWQADGKIRESLDAPVDLLIIEDAETLTDADLLKLCRHAQRCVLVSAALSEAAASPATSEKAARVPLVAASCWNRLWSALGGDANPWPVTWRRDQGRLCCQLTPLGAEDLHHLDRECLVDAAEIELGILHRPQTRPCLAQVIFPPEHRFAEAFTFMVREVQEFPLQPVGRTGWWTEDAERLCWRLGTTRSHESAFLTIEAGVQLAIAGDESGDESTRVACIEFAKEHGWDRAKAEEWLNRHRRGRDAERTVFLQTPYRFDRRLASAVQSIVRPGEWLSDALVESATTAGLEFVAMPAPAKHDWPREGSGLELDLSGSRQGDRMPAGLRPGLPARGIVNFLEAQALVRRVEMWMQRESIGADVRVGLMALFASQVELLRRLVEQSALLRSRSFHLEVALPSRLHQWECDIAFLSLTRSHAHRCVAFGEDARELPLALTRARTRLVIFGDPGCLCKRAAWCGPLEHLDAHSAHQEQVRLARLLAFVQNHAPALVNGSANGK